MARGKGAYIASKMTLAGPAAAELRLGGSTPAEKVLLAKRWCDANATCTGFAIDPGFAVTLSRMLNTTGGLVYNDF